MYVLTLAQHLMPCCAVLQITGSGNGAGQNPVSTTSYIAIVNNVCPQCAYGDIDLQVTCFAFLSFAETLPAFC